MTSSLLQEKKKIEDIGRNHTFSDIKHGSLVGFLPHFIASFETTLIADVFLHFTWMLQETLMTTSSTQHLCNFLIILIVVYSCRFVLIESSWLFENCSGF